MLRHVSVKSLGTDSELFFSYVQNHTKNWEICDKLEYTAITCQSHSNCTHKAINNYN